MDVRATCSISKDQRGSYMGTMYIVVNGNVCGHAMVSAAGVDAVRALGQALIDYAGTQSRIVIPPHQLPPIGGGAEQ